MRANVEHGVDADWTSVSGTTPCPVCGGFERCRTHVAEQLACCVAEPSEWRLANGGWLHRLELTPAVAARLAGEPRAGDVSSGVVS